MKDKAKKIWAGIRAAVTSPEVVAAERSMAALIVTRALLATGASAALIKLVASLITG